MGLQLNLIISMKRPAGAEGTDREHGIQMDKRGLTSAIFPPRLSCCLSVSMAAVFIHHVLYSVKFVLLVLREDDN